MFSCNQLHVIMPSAGPRVETFYPSLIAFTQTYGITSVARLAAFFATIAVESGELLYTKELWGPTDQQKTYEGRADLGNNQPGDGFLFRGRGLIQITGRANYAFASAALGVNYVSDPDSMSTPQEAVRTACWWWNQKGCNEASDIPDFRKVTRIVNGGYTDWDKRVDYYMRAVKVLPPQGD